MLWWGHGGREEGKGRGAGGGRAITRSWDLHVKGAASLRLAPPQSASAPRPVYPHAFQALSLETRFANAGSLAAGRREG